MSRRGRHDTPSPPRCRSPHSRSRSHSLSRCRSRSRSIDRPMNYSASSAPKRQRLDTPSPPRSRSRSPSSAKATAFQQRRRLDTPSPPPRSPHDHLMPRSRSSSSSSSGSERGGARRSREERKRRKQERKEKKRLKKEKKKSKKEAKRNRHQDSNILLEREDGSVAMILQGGAENGPAASTEYKSFFDALRAQEADKEPVGTFHASGVHRKSGAGAAVVKTGEWECPKCFKKNHKNNLQCEGCRAMRRLNDGWR